MARLWILLLIVWYKAFTIVHTEDIRQSDGSKQENGENLLLLPDEREDKLTHNDVYYGQKNSDDVGIGIDNLMRYIMLMSQRGAYELKQDNEFPNDNTLSEVANFKQDKRNFHAWGGKRDIPSPKRPSFHSWGGKRGITSNNLNSDLNDLTTDKRNAEAANRPYFSSFPIDMWGEKRMYDEDNSSGNILKEYVDYNSPLKDINAMGRRRLKFSSWGGKRSDNPVYDVQAALKRNFHSWGGK